MSDVDSVKDLFDNAKKGQKLTSGERRRVIAYLQTSNETSFNGAELSKIFQVNETIIRQDKKAIKDALVRQLRDDGDIKYVISDIMVDFTKVATELELGLKVTKTGSLLHLKFAEAILDTRLKVVKTLQDLGWFPRNLGTISEEKWIYKAEYGSDGHVSSQKIVNRKEKTFKKSDKEIDIAPKEIAEEVKDEFKFKALSE